MAEIETTPDIITGDDIGANAIDHTVVADSFINVSSSDPTVAADTGLGYVVGSIWVNSSSGNIFQCTGTTAEDATWINQDGDSVNLFLHQANTVVGKSGGTRDGSGAPGPSNYMSLTIESMPIASEGNSTDIGEMSPSLGIKGHQIGCAKDGYPASFTYQYGLMGLHPSNQHISEMTRHAVTSPATLVDIGEETNAHSTGGLGQSKTNWFVWSGGGYGPSTTGVNPSGPFTTQIEKSTFASPTTSTDSGGDLSVATGSSLGFTDLVGAKCWAMGGEAQPAASNTEKIESFPTAISSGNQTDEGELSTGGLGNGGTSASTTNWYISGYNPTAGHLLKGSFTAPVTDSDIGELNVACYVGTAASGSTYGYRFGGKIPSPYTSIDSIEKWSYTSDGNGTDVSEMSENSAGVGCWQD